MPVITTKDSAPAVAAALRAEADETGRPAYVVVYASHRGGRSWCPDCTAAEPFIEGKFAGEENGTVRVVYAGLPEEWRTKDNQWRQEPFNVTNLPTLIKVTDKKWEKLVEADVYDQKKLDAFVAGGRR